MGRRPNVNSEGDKELAKIEDNLNQFNEQVSELSKSLDIGVAGQADPQTLLSKKEVQKLDAPKLEPKRSIGNFVDRKTGFKPKENPKFAKQYKEDWEYIKVIFENYEQIGVDIEVWTKKYPQDPAQFWVVPTNKPVYVPRLLAKQISSCSYHRLKSEQQTTENHGFAQITGGIVVDHVVQRLGARNAASGF